MQLLQITDRQEDVAGKWRIFYNYEDGSGTYSNYLKFQSNPTDEEFQATFSEWSNNLLAERQRQLDEKKIQLELLQKEIAALELI